jgi:hypothetical protein
MLSLLVLDRRVGSGKKDNVRISTNSNKIIIVIIVTICISMALSFQRSYNTFLNISFKFKSIYKEVRASTLKFYYEI